MIFAVGDRPSVAAEADPFAAQHEQNRRASKALIAEGDAFLEQQDAGGAIGMYERALVADPASVVALRKLGIAYQSVGLYSDEIKYCTLALALDPNDVPSLACQGIGAAHREGFEVAVENLRKIKTLCSDICPEYNALSQALKENFPQRWRHVKKSLKSAR